MSTIVLVIISLIMGSCIKEKQTGAELVVGDRIPEFTVTLDSGVSVSGTDLSQGVSCIVFFHTTCPDCRKVLPILQEVYEQYCSKDVKFLLISREELAESIELFWTENSLTMPYSAQKDRSVYEKFVETITQFYLPPANDSNLYWRAFSVHLTMGEYAKIMLI